MTRTTTVLAVAALMVAGTSAALAVGTAPQATSDAALAQDTETTTVEEGTGTGEDGETTTEAVAQADAASVTFLNQSAGFTFTGEGPNTTTVMVERVVVPEGGFVAIHEAENVTGDYDPAENVSVGAVVGNSTYLEPGEHSNVVVEIDGDLEESQTLVAMLHRDTNDNREYDFPEADDPYATDGAPVIETAFVIADYGVVEDAGEDGANETTTA